LPDFGRRTNEDSDNNYIESSHRVFGDWLVGWTNSCTFVSGSATLVYIYNLYTIIIFQIELKIGESLVDGQSKSKQKNGDVL